MKWGKIALSECVGGAKARQIGANWVCFAKKHFAAADGLTIAGMVAGFWWMGSEDRGDGMKLPEGKRPGRRVAL
jgi:hypothetical protein